MTRRRWIGLLTALALLGGAAAFAALPRASPLKRAATWQRLASPGRLSVAHAFLEDNCAACHRAVRGVEAANCAACHANNESLLQRQPTAFHANVGSCRECHPEHQGGKRPPTLVDHAALAAIVLRRHPELAAWVTRQDAGGGLSPDHPHITPAEAALDCAACHGNKDRHAGLFGRDCAQCHGTEGWTVAEFRHPSLRSTDCAQCHQAPASHFMEHFHMVSMRVAGQPHAQVNQCHLCHQTTAWNDIRGVGWYKHH
jgi:hypothetical protein